MIQFQSMDSNKYIIIMIYLEVLQLIWTDN